MTLSAVWGGQHSAGIGFNSFYTLGCHPYIVRCYGARRASFRRLMKVQQTCCARAETFAFLPKPAIRQHAIGPFTGRMAKGSIPNNEAKI